MKLNTQIELNNILINVTVEFDVEGDPGGNIVTIQSITTETGETIPYSADYDLEFECSQQYQQKVFDNYRKYGHFVYDINDPKEF